MLPVFSPLPLAGDGLGRRWHTDAFCFVDAPALTPTPLPRAGEGSVHQG